MMLTILARKLKALTRFLIFLTIMTALTPSRSSAAETNSAGRTIKVRRYLVEGNSVVTQEYVDSIFAKAMGDNVKPEQVQAAIERVQQFCDEFDYPVQIKISSQGVTNGIVHLKISELPADAAAEKELLIIKTNPLVLYTIADPNPPALQSFEASIKPTTNEIAKVKIVPHNTGTITNRLSKPIINLAARTYRIEGEDVLTPKIVNATFADVIGTNVNLERLSSDVGKLQKLCDTFRYQVQVAVPEQTITNGIVLIQIAKRESRVAETNAVVTRNLFSDYVPPTTNTPGFFLVNGYHIEGNTILPPEKFGYLSNYTGVVNISRVREGLNQLQDKYHDLGFPTVSVVLPKQKLTNGIVRARIVEGRISDIVIKGNRYYRAENIRRALPDLQTNILLNTKWFEPELDIANGNQDRQIYPVVGPGPDPGTAALTLQVKDQLPLHGHVELDNRSSPGTPVLRLDSAVQYNNLWQLDHQIGFQSSFSPEQYTDQSVNFYDEPMVASYSGFYRMPLGYGDGLREKYENLPVDFGYSEVTHHFDLPAPTGRPETIFYASHSVSDGGVNVGPMSILSQSSSLLVNNQTYQHSLTENEGLGARFIQPLPVIKNIQSSFSAGLDYKYYDIRNFTTNITIVNDISNNVSLPITITNNPENHLFYLPLTLGWSGSESDGHGFTTFSVNDSIFLQALSAKESSFEAVAGSPRAGGNYTTITANFDREQKLPADWSLSLKAGGQWANEPLISNEQFPLGGTSSVRGYQEGEAYGDTGWHTQFDLHAPAVNVGYFPTANADVPAELRCSLFMDYGEAYSLSQSASIQEWGTGVGFLLNVGEHLDARLQVAWALHDTPLTQMGTTRVYFSLGAQF
jgi:hemolysin activation/secretion protein